MLISSAPRGPRTLASIALVSLGVVGLTGCGTSGEKEFTAFTRAVQQVPGLTSFESGTTSPLPWQKNGWVKVALPAEPDTFETLTSVVCQQPAGIPLSFGYTLTGDHSTLEVDSTPCPPEHFDPLKTVAAADSLGTASSVQVRQSQRAESASATPNPAQADLRIKLTTDQTIVQDLALAQALSASLGDTTTEFSGQDLRLQTLDTEERDTVLSDLAALNERFPLASVDFAQKLTLGTVGEADPAAITAFLTERSPDLYRTHGIVAATGSVGAGGAVPTADAIALRNWATENLGVQVTALSNSIQLSVPDVAALDSASTALAEHGVGDVSVRFEVADGGPTAPELGVGTAPKQSLSPTNNPFPAVIERYRSIAATDRVQRVEFAPGGLKVWLREEFRGDTAATDAVGEVLIRIATEDKLRTVRLDNRPVGDFR
ncbi:hypothetical protein D9V34_02090 [Mycetocola lacteus]|uniref:Uncharacterized protein n=1 Tax=Mycetocola lacteus TaxID=76637 RepID=A0A3L7AYZ0_9MICO|nr:hypothetical protein [Mycetocola lacteus]RLP84810.1 hypothetical protein D9V34_02090 [Mycetocola lacteus]